MGSLFGSKTTTTSKQTPFSGKQKDWYEGFQPYLMGRVNNPIRYGGETAAPINQTQSDAIGKLQDSAANRTLQDYAEGAYIDPMSNPYVTAQADAIRQAGQEAWGEQGRQVNDLFNKNSFWGGSAHQDQLAKTQKDVNRSTQNSLASLYGSAYNSGVNQMLNAQGARQSAAEALLNAGNTEYGITDTKAQRDLELFFREQGLDEQTIQDYLSYLGLGKNPTQTQTQSSNGLGGVLGSLAGGWASTWK